MYGVQKGMIQIDMMMAMEKGESFQLVYLHTI